MNNLSCRKETVLTAEEKSVFDGHLERLGLSDNLWDLFGEWVARSTPAVSFFYLKVFKECKLMGLGMFLKVKPVDLRTSYVGLRRNAFLNAIAGLFSSVSNNCLYVSFRNLITSNLARPFFYREQAEAEDVMKAILSYLKKVKEADMVTVIDTLDHDELYRKEKFAAYPCSSEAFLDAERYGDISDYLAEHRSLRKNLAKKKFPSAEVWRGPVSEEDRRQMKACVDCSVVTSPVNNPCQKFFEDNIFGTEVYHSDKYVHIAVRVDGVIAGFHTFQVSGADMGGVLGGFNRDYSRGHFPYERVIITSLDYAIKNKFKRVHYSLIDNQTKLRLVKSVEPCALYFYSSNALNRKVFEKTFRFNDIYNLSLLERQGIKEQKF